MADPITLSAIGAVALTEGIKFLYAQAGELIKNWRERKATSQTDAPQPTQPVPTQVALPPVFESTLTEPKIHYDALERIEPELLALRKTLADYAEGLETVDTKDEDLLAQVDAVRKMLEAVYQQPIRFKGEPAPASAPELVARIDVEKVLSEVTGIKARLVRSGKLSADIKAKEVSGKLTGIDVDTVG